jgi:hypothetical protein
VRDPLGLVRAYYVMRRAEGWREGPLLDDVVAIGAELSKALELGQRCAIGTAGHAAAWRRAERATANAANLVRGISEGAEPIVKAACGRVLRGK